MTRPVLALSLATESLEEPIDHAAVRECRQQEWLTVSERGDETVEMQNDVTLHDDQ